MKFVPPIVKMKVLAFMDQSPEPSIVERARKAADIYFIDESNPHEKLSSPGKPLSHGIIAIKNMVQKF